MLPLPSVENKRWAHVSPASQSLSLTMLFGDLGRWREFAFSRFEQMRNSGIFHEAVFVVNQSNSETIRSVTADVRERFEDFPLTVLFSGENNIPAGRNAAVARARGESVLVWDDDDGVNPEALRKAYQDVFVPGRFQLLELPLAHPDGSAFHPQPEAVMPQMLLPGRQDLLVMGMVHTPFLASRTLLTSVPIPEYVALRGDWLHWSAQLWRMGVPILCLKGEVAREALRPRVVGATASIKVNDAARFHALVSLLFLFYKYAIDPQSRECAIIRQRYFDKYEEREGGWQQLLDFAKALHHGAEAPSTASLSSFARNHPMLVRAYLHVKEFLTMVNGKGLPSMRAAPKFNVGPFEMLSPHRQGELEIVLRSVQGV